MRKHGVTLVELLIALVVVMILLSSATYIFVNFVATSVAQERVAWTQSDVQTAMQVLKWDILMTGFAIQSEEQAAVIFDGDGYNNSDILVLRSLMFDPHHGGAWSYILEPVQNTTTIPIRRWNDPDKDIPVEETVIIMSPEKYRLGFQFMVISRDTFTHSSGQPAYMLEVSQPVSVSQNFIFGVGGKPIPNIAAYRAQSNVFWFTPSLREVAYQVHEGTLIRDSIPVLDNVHDFQVAFWVDENGNQIQDPGEWHTDLSIMETRPDLRNKIRLLRITLLMGTQPESQYYVQETFDIEGNVLSPDPNLKYQEWKQYAKPRNIR